VKTTKSKSFYQHFPTFSPPFSDPFPTMAGGVGGLGLAAAEALVPIGGRREKNGGDFKNGRK
jgi:hypothetical protein